MIRKQLPGLTVRPFPNKPTWALFSVESGIKESGAARNLLTTASAAAQERNASVILKKLHFIQHEFSSWMVLLLL